MVDGTSQVKDVKKRAATLQSLGLWLGLAVVVGGGFLLHRTREQGEAATYRSQKSAAHAQMRREIEHGRVVGGLKRAARTGDVATFASIMDRVTLSAIPNISNVGIGELFNALYAAAACGRVNILQDWYSRPWPSGMDKGLLSNDLLRYASASDNSETVRFLVDNGADPQADPYNTPLVYAVMRDTDGAAKIARLLIEAGANVKAPWLFHTGVDKALRSLNLNPTAPVPRRDAARMDWYGWTPLMMAARSGRADVALALLGKGADASAKSPAGETALDIARRCGRESVVRVLQGAGQALSRE